MTNQWDTYAYNKGIGPDGDAFHKKLIDPLIFRYIGENRYHSILDVGCGNGYLLIKLSSKTKSVIGIDNSRKLLSVASHNITGLSNVTAVYGDISQKLPFNSASFDVIIANMVLQYLPSLERISSESARVLKKNGVFIVVMDHPCHALYLRAQELAGSKNDKFLTSASYFVSGKRRKKSLWDKATLEYYHRPMEGYINPFTPYFHLDTMTEISEDGEMPRILGLKWSKL